MNVKSLTTLQNWSWAHTSPKLCFCWVSIWEAFAHGQWQCSLPKSAPCEWTCCGALACRVCIYSYQISWYSCCIPVGHIGLKLIILFPFSYTLVPAKLGPHLVAKQKLKVCIWAMWVGVLYFLSNSGLQGSGLQSVCSHKYNNADRGCSQCGTHQIPGCWSIKHAGYVLWPAKANVQWLVRYTILSRRGHQR